VVTICTASLTSNNSTFCPHSVFMCFVWISEQTAIISLYSINWLVCITETQCVYCAVRTGYIYENYFHIIKSIFQIMRLYMKDKSTFCSPNFNPLLSPFWRLNQQTHYKCTANWRTSSRSLGTSSKLMPIQICFKLSKLLLHAYCLLLLMELTEHRTKCSVQQPFTAPTDSVEWTLCGVGATDWMVAVHNIVIHLVVCG